MACTSNELLASARCLCGLSPLDHLAIQTYLLCQLVIGGGIGGGGTIQVLEYTTTDPATDGIFPADQTKAAIAYKQDGTGTTFVWNTSTLAWN